MTEVESIIRNYQRGKPGYKPYLVTAVINGVELKKYLVLARSTAQALSQAKSAFYTDFIRTLPLRIEGTLHLVIKDKGDKKIDVIDMDVAEAINNDLISPLNIIVHVINKTEFLVKELPAYLLYSLSDLEKNGVNII